MACLPYQRNVSKAQEERQREFPEYRYTAVLEIKQTGKMEGPKGYLQEKKILSIQSSI